MKATFLQLALGVTGTLAIWKDSKGWKDFRDGSDLQHFVTVCESGTTQSKSDI
jgi:hypothetical protein